MEFSEKGNVDLVVISTHARGGLKRGVVGRIAAAVIRKSEEPET